MFQFDEQWDVDKAAESLNTSLFGKPKKQKFSGTPSLTLLDKSYTSAIPDSDDEQYTKKDKKKMKKWRNKNKVDNKTSEIDSTELNEGKDTDGKKMGAKKSVKKGGTTTEDSGQKMKIISPVKKKSDIANAKSQKLKKESKHQEPNLNTLSHEKAMEIISPVKKKSDIANAKSQKVKKESKHQEPNLNTSSHENLIEKKSKKRKRSLSQSTDDVVGSKNKMAKVGEHKNSTVANGDVAESGEGKKKRKRNRKKKNNSKKNKYKHLALNSKNKPENSDISHDGGSPVLEPTKNKSTLPSQKPKSDKSLEYIHKNTDISSVVSLSDSAVLVHKQDTSKDNHTGSLTLDSQIQNKSKKRKKVRDSELAPTKKLKQGKNNSRDESPIPSSDIPLTPKTSNSGEQTSAQLSISLKNKKKQQVLLKLLNPTQIQKQDSSNVNNKKDSTSGKKKSKLLLENGSANNNKNSTQHENQQESISENVHKKPKVNASHSIWGKAAELGQQAKEKLDSARFRYINEQLYSCTGGDALKLFREDRTAFSVYHEGFQNQVNKWPVNPLDIFIKQIKDKPKNLVIADFGCGDAKLAQSVPQKVHSFDLVALNNRITVCDMSKTPLPGEKVDIAIFCLSLMGTNITDYILEANRVLKTGGLLKIAEVVSRFSGLSRFVEAVCNCGFQLLNKRDTDQMFYLFDFKKIKPVKKSATVGEIKLKPCIYKRR